MDAPRVVVTAEDPKARNQARSLAQDLALEFIEAPAVVTGTGATTADFSGADFLLSCGDEGLSLVFADGGSPQESREGGERESREGGERSRREVRRKHEPSLSGVASGVPLVIRVDFNSAALQWRVSHALSRQDIVRAAGIRSGHRPAVIDATAGLGKDAFLLAWLGCHVTLFERSAVVHALLRDGLERALRGDPQVAEAAGRMTLIQGDFTEAKPGSGAAEVVYLDPMFPPRQKSARVKKDLFALQGLLGHEPPARGLLDKALGAASRRVVVKRPRLADPLDGKNPDFSFRGKTSRYDVYLK